MKEVVSVLNMSNSDKNTIATYNNSKDLMWNAAFGVYSSANWFGNIAIVCGTGNNAGDGYALSIILKENKINCTLLLIEERFSEDGKYYFDKAKQLGIKHYLINDNTSEPVALLLLNEPSLYSSSEDVLVSSSTASNKNELLNPSVPVIDNACFCAVVAASKIPSQDFT